MTRRNIMIDIETMGKGPRSAIAAIGAVEFDPAGNDLGRALYARVDLRSSVAAGLVIDADTVLWWMQQSDDARAELTSGNTVPLHHALVSLADLVMGEDRTDHDAIVWANGTSFDFPILAEAYRAVGLPQPWHYFNERDWRTIRKVLPAAQCEREGTAHNALDDACHQARHLQRVIRSALETESYAAQAKRLAMELECLMLSCKDDAAVSTWWDSANEALEAFRATGRESACN
jgi:hypothetical protein